jgi:Pectate lyase superfamily protein
LLDPYGGSLAVSKPKEIPVGHSAPSPAPPPAPGQSRRGFLAGAASAAVVSGTIGALAAGSPSAEAATDLTYAGPSDWYNVQVNGGAKGDGVTDDTEALQSSIDTVAAGGGGVVYFPAGKYSTKAPLVVSSSGIVLLGAGPIATQGGGGSGSGKFTPGSTTPTIINTVFAGTFIVPSANWSQSGAKAPAAILVDASAGEVDRVAIDRMWVFGGDAGNTTVSGKLGPKTVHGIAAYGKANALCVRGCGVLVLYSTESNGIYMIPGTSTDKVGAVEPDGAFIDQCLCQDIGGSGIQGSFGDATITRCHTQQVGNAGYNLVVTVSPGGNIRVSDCRADEGQNGFFMDVTCHTDLGMIQIVNCSTQGNLGNGFYIRNAADHEISPVYLANCVAQGDGIKGGSGYLISGPCGVTMSNCACHVDTAVVGTGVPEHAVVTTDGKVGAPVFVQILGGFMNSRGTWSHSANAPLVSDVRVVTYGGRQWTGQRPTLATSL